MVKKWRIAGLDLALKFEWGATQRRLRRELAAEKVKVAETRQGAKDQIDELKQEIVKARRSTARKQLAEAVVIAADAWRHGRNKNVPMTPDEQGIVVALHNLTGPLNTPWEGKGSRSHE